jgi:hypothetical protein
MASRLACTLAIFNPIDTSDVADYVVECASDGDR